MSDELLKRLSTQRTTLAFKNGDFARTFFDLIDEDEKSYPLLYDNNRNCYAYSYKEDVGFFTKVFVFKDDKYDEEIKINVSIYNNVVVIFSSSNKDDIMGLLYQYKEHFVRKHYNRVVLMEEFASM